MFSPLYKLRINNKLTIDELVAQSSLAKQTIINIEHGRQKRIYKSVLTKISTFFQIDPFKFYEEYQQYYKSLQNTNN